jgi:hypothetical protein
MRITLSKLILLGVIYLSCISAANAQSNYNFDNCRFGNYSCDQSLLTDQQRSIVHQAALTRNFDSCRFGNYSCDQSLLTDQQKAIAHQAALTRNFDSCRFGNYSCDQSLLTSEQLTQITNGNVGDQQYTARSCAENGSCYGDISELTGQPKTTRVNGYYRRDGTYVRGHYRSR